MQKDQEIGLVTGVWDLLHVGHVARIKETLGKVEQLVIGVEPDVRVAALKGAGRPVVGEQERQRRLRKLFPSAKVVILPVEFGQEEVREKWLREWRVNKLLMAANDERAVSKKTMMQKVGGEVILLRSHSEISTTGILRGEQSSDNLVWVEDRERLRREKGKNEK
jgi:cytidyltransferase-like protein